MATTNLPDRYRAANLPVLLEGTRLPGMAGPPWPSRTGWTCAASIRSSGAACRFSC